MSFLFAGGPVLALALVPMPAETARKLAFIAGFGLLGLLVTGVGAIALTGGALGQLTWLRVSMGLFLVCGALMGRLRGVAKRGGAVRPLAGVITGVLAVVVYLMETKPF
ncbi:MAG: hypothetical protein QM723_04735 [Myxococcaceae bacterium]